MLLFNSFNRIFEHFFIFSFLFLPIELADKIFNVFGKLQVGEEQDKQHEKRIANDLGLLLSVIMVDL